MLRKTLFSVLVIVCLSSVSTVTADCRSKYIVPARAAMFEGSLSGLRDAYKILDAGKKDSICDANRELVFLHALTGAEMLFIDNNDVALTNSFIELAKDFGIEITGDYFTELEINLGGCYEIPEGAPDANNVAQRIQNSIIPKIDAILAELGTIGDSPSDRFRIFFEPAETGLDKNLEVDYGEVMVLKFLLTALKSQLEFRQAYNLAIDVNDPKVKEFIGRIFCGQEPNVVFNINNDFLNRYLDLLKVLPDGGTVLAQSKQDLIDSINYYFSVIDYIESETDGQEDDLIYIDPNSRPQVDLVGERLRTLRDSLLNDTAGTYLLETTKTYRVYRDSTLVGQLVLTYININGIEGDEGTLTFDNDTITSPWRVWNIDWFGGTGSDFEIDFDYESSPTEDRSGYFVGTLSSDGNSITNGVFDYWGDKCCPWSSYSGTVSGLSATLTGTQNVYGRLDLNPVFGGSGRYPTPVNPRDLLPDVNDSNKVIPYTFGHGLGDDATLGGILPDMNQNDWAVLFGLASQPTVNVALGKKATQSSTSGGNVASRAVDGNTDGILAHNSVTMTNSETHPWWEVDLGGICNIDAIDVWNRTDSVAVKQRLDDFYVIVSDVPFASKDLTTTLSQEGVWSRHITSYPDPRVRLWVGQGGRYVRIQLGDTNYLNLAEVKVFGEVYVPVDNVALGKKATQSSTSGGGVASRAVDGNTDGIFAHNSVTMTNSEVNPRWEVDLGGFCNIDEIDVWNRTDSVAIKGRLDDFYVIVSDVPFVSNDLTTTLSQDGVWSRHITSYPDPRVRLWVGQGGRYIRIQLGDTNYLNLAEVKVFGEAYVPVDDVALGKKATQSSTSSGGVALRAVDGNVDGVWSHNSVTMTNSETHPWWEVDLGGICNIDEIDVWNRTDSVAIKGRLDNFYVIVSDVPFTSKDLTTTLSQDGVWSRHITSYPDPKTRLWVGKGGRYVRIQLGDTNYLNLAEVKVYGKTFVPVDNVALGKKATQSSTSGGNVASRAVDGNTDGILAHNSVTMTNSETHPRWEVDLGGICNIDQIDVWNRTDSVAVKQRLDNFYVIVSDVPFVSNDLTTTLSQEGVWSRHITSYPDPRVRLWVGQGGRYVRIQLGDTNYLNLAEVKVFGEAFVSGD